MNRIDLDTGWSLRHVAGPVPEPIPESIPAEFGSAVDAANVTQLTIEGLRGDAAHPNRDPRIHYRDQNGSTHE